MKPLLIIKTGTTVNGLHERRGDFEAWIAEVLGEPVPDLTVASVYLGAPLPEPSEVGAVIITGSPAMVTDREDWSEYTAAWLQQAVAIELPVLGICYGHQLIAHALGGTVGWHPKGREIGTVEVQLNQEANTDLLFGKVHSPFPAHVSHSQTVVQLPSGAVILGGNAFEPHHVVRFAPSVWGVQFHPEFDEGIMCAYISARRQALVDEGLAPDRLLEQVCPTPAASALLRVFASLAGVAGKLD